MEKSTRLRLRMMLGPNIAIGPGKADLLQAIADTGSITAAARALAMSYRRTWALADIMNRCFREPVIDTAKGGPSGGGATLTPFGRDVLQRYRHMEAKALRAIERDAQEFQTLISARPKEGA